jgi:hypothetical protein
MAHFCQPDFPIAAKASFFISKSTQKVFYFIKSLDN